MDHKAYSAIHQTAGSLVTGRFVGERFYQWLGESRCKCKRALKLYRLFVPEQIQ